MSRRSPLRPDTVTALRVLAVIAALAAAGAPSCSSGGARRRVAVVDVSASAVPVSMGDAVRRCAEGLDDGDELAVVAFGDGFRALGPERVSAWRAGVHDADAQELAAPALRRASRLGEGLAAAAGRLRSARDGVRRDVVVLTDARVTDTREERASGAFALRAAGCEAVRLAPVAAHAPGPRVLQVRGPGNARRGDAFSLYVDGVAGTGGARVELIEEARLVAARDVAAGAFRTVFLVPARRAGERVFQARISGGEDAEARAHVVILDAARLLAFAEPGRAAALRACTGRDVLVASGTSVRDVSSLLAAHPAVVLDGLPSGDVAPAVESALLAHVRGGGGLVFLGGPAAFAHGGWGARPLDAVAPLRSAPPQLGRRVVHLALDGSGSMSEPWPGATATRDAVVRDAATRLLRSLPPGTDVLVRRFAGGLLPAGSPGESLPSDTDNGLARLVARIEGLAAPRGATRLLPVFEETRGLAHSHAAGRVHAVLFTDGRTAEPAAALVEAVAGVLRRAASVTVVAPEDAAVSEVLDTLRSAGATVRTVREAGDLADALGAAVATALADAAFLEGRAAELTAGADERVPGVEAPSGAVRVQRTYPSSDADVLVRTTEGEPVAAIRREGLGLVAALATRAGDVAWLPDGDGGLVRALTAAVSGAVAPGVRVERRGDVVLIAAPGDAVPARMRWSDGGAPRESAVAPHAGGLFRAMVPAQISFATLEAHDGRTLGTVGLDVPAAPEASHPAPSDLAPVVRLAAAPRPAGGTPLAPWLSALALLLLVAGHAWAASPRGFK